MSDSDLEAKFRGLAEGVLPLGRDRRGHRSVLADLTALEDAGALARAAVPQ